MAEPSDGSGANQQKKNPGADSKNAPGSGQMMLLKVPDGQGLNNEKEAEAKLKELNDDNKKGQLGLAFDKRHQAFDIYENDEMIDCFMDDIDEMSMCEGSRQSQQDFNYNARGTMSQKKNVILDTNNWPRGPQPVGGQAFPYQMGGRTSTSPYASSALDSRG